MVRPTLSMSAIPTGNSSSSGDPNAYPNTRPKIFLQPKKLSDSNADKEIVLDDFLNDSTESLSPPPPNPSMIRDHSINNSAHCALPIATSVGDVVAAYEKMLAFGCDFEKVVSKMKFDNIPLEHIERFTKEHSRK